MPLQAASSTSPIPPLMSPPPGDPPRIANSGNAAPWAPLHSAAPKVSLTPSRDPVPKKAMPKHTPPKAEAPAAPIPADPQNLALNIFHQMIERGEAVDVNDIPAWRRARDIAADMHPIAAGPADFIAMVPINLPAPEVPPKQPQPAPPRDAQAAAPDLAIAKAKNVHIPPPASNWEIDHHPLPSHGNVPNWDDQYTSESDSDIHVWGPALFARRDAAAKAKAEHPAPAVPGGAAIRDGPRRPNHEARPPQRPAGAAASSSSSHAGPY